VTAPLTERDVENPRQRRRGGDRSILGLLLIGLGTLWFLEETGLLALSAETVLAALLMLVGLGLIFTARRGRRRWPIILGTVLTLVLIANSNALSLPNMGNVGEELFQPANAAELHNSYQSGVGTMTVDFRLLSAADLAKRTIHVSHGVGQVIVLVPAGLSLHVEGSIGVGRLTLCGKRVAGGPGISGPHDYQSGASTPLLTLIIHQGVGGATIRGCGTDAAPLPLPTALPSPGPPST
jgi:hypothetical protein